ncbi:MAG TPA: SURF1 family protein [Acidimicrobiia bacterium]|nr:SURF1 family protein [Acidimicrobiia bacterium]
MWNLLKTPRWAIATVVVFAICVVCVALGQWQLGRHEERKVQNVVMTNRLAEDPLPLATLVDAAGADVDSLEYRPVTAVGEFRPDDEILVRSQTANQRPGFHVVTPLATEGGVVLVNRGWVPLAVETPPVAAAPPPSGTVTVTGLARLSQTRPSIGPVEPDGRLAIVARIDLERLSGQFEGLTPVWIQQIDEPEGPLPIRVPIPPVDDPGPHLPYAIQWFSFAAIGAIGYGLLVRRALRTGG